MNACFKSLLEAWLMLQDVWLGPLEAWLGLLGILALGLSSEWFPRIFGCRPWRPDSCPATSRF